MDITDLRTAAQRLAGIANATPVMTSRSLNQQCNSQIFLKCENFQRTGSFKFRGAYNAMAQAQTKGVLTYSSGNHGQAMALAGSLLGIATAIVMPDDAARSVRTGILQTIHNPDTIADGARTPSLGKITFPLIRQYVDDIVTVSESGIIRAMFYLWERLKIVVEPTGALATAAILENIVDVSGMRVGAIVSGGNVDLIEIGQLFATSENLDIF